MNGSGCQGAQFSVLPHQYIGVRSNKCRLGFARPPLNPVFATTWTHSEGSDPFAKPYKPINYVPANYTILQSITIDSSESKGIRQANKPESIGTTRPRVLFIGSYPSRQCGLAKFLQDLTGSYQGPYSVVAVDEDGVEPSARNYSQDIVFRLKQNERDDYYAIAEMANSEAYDVINVEHEYGLYGGMSGEYIVILLAAIRKPVIVTMHTILSEPNPFYLSLTRAIVATSTRIVVLSTHGRRLLADVYGVNEAKISVVPHGVPDVPFAHTLNEAKIKLGFEADRPIMATFGLLHRNKNIELVLKAMQSAVESVPNILYLVLGQTHPLIKLKEGETYRRELASNVTAFRLTENVHFVDKYLEDNELLSYLSASDIYITPYANEDQYVSGTLSWAVGLGKAVVSTPYLCAKELLADGRGFLVPFGDHNVLSSTIVRLTQDQEIRDGARRKAYKFGRQMTWSNVADEHEHVFREVLLYA
ncbi:unnamed protein product [Didymodactylos carnosus]|uniref:Glycosyltransferase n=1 Tax=Didymodactylos carnosus TaxID=1234261 RepID=A0A815E342_9BILA|nr:unnamed protein product [Didymodactylos carnosus]CAF4126410.1 unnamed protein product [Didymodactylos carnosus]